MHVLNHSVKCISHCSHSQKSLKATGFPGSNIGRIYSAMYADSLRWDQKEKEKLLHHFQEDDAQKERSLNLPWIDTTVLLSISLPNQLFPPDKNGAKAMVSSHFEIHTCGKCHKLF